MEFDISLLCLQGPFSSPQSELDASGPYSTILFFNIYFNMLPSMPRFYK